MKSVAGVCWAQMLVAPVYFILLNVSFLFIDTLKDSKQNPTPMKNLCLTCVLIVGVLSLCSDFAAGAEPATPLPRQEVRAKVDRLMRTLPRLTAEKRTQAISELYEILTSTTPEVRDAVRYFGIALTSKSDGSVSLSAEADRQLVLSKIFPILITTLDGPEKLDVKAHRLLTSLQPDCPPPDRAIWEAWWKETSPTMVAPKSSQDTPRD